MDCPESAHFGSPGQPFADVATKFTESELAGKRVRLQLLSRDQYGRAVAMVTYRRASGAGTSRWSCFDAASRWSTGRGRAVRQRRPRRGAVEPHREAGEATERGPLGRERAAVDPAAYKKREREKKSKGR